MKTDELFYELFKVDPKSIFRLVQLNIEGEYSFESLTIKTTEKRLDGFGKRIDGPGPNAFVEIQGYDDSKIYWRSFLTRIVRIFDYSTFSEYDPKGDRKHAAINPN